MDKGGCDMSKYLTVTQRYQIETMLKDGLSPKQIADRLGKHYTTIYKEIKKGLVTFRNGDWTERKEYCADVAQRVTDERQTKKGRDLKIGNDFALAGHIEYLIGEKHYSPYAASIDIKKRDFSVTLCKGTIYRYIDMGLFLNISNKNLYSKRRKRKKKYDHVRPSHKNLKGTSIEQRPKHINKRDSYGHWEMDTVYSGKKKSKSCLLVLTERMTRQEYILRMPDRTIYSTVDAINKLEITLGYHAFKERFKTITVDNGSEFSDYEALEKSCMYPEQKRTSIYFCHAYASSERASNENANKLIRHWIPKSGDIGSYSDDDISHIQEWVNDYPREMFSGLSSNEYMRLKGIG